MVVEGGVVVVVGAVAAVAGVEVADQGVEAEVVEVGPVVEVEEPVEVAVAVAAVQVEIWSTAETVMKEPKGQASRTDMARATVPLRPRHRHHHVPARYPKPDEPTGTGV